MSDKRTRISVFDYTLHLVGGATMMLTGALSLYRASEAWQFASACGFICAGLLMIVATLRKNRF